MLATQGGGREAMASLAARLMAGSDHRSTHDAPSSAPASASAAHRATIPRTVPAPRAAPTQPPVQQTHTSNPSHSSASSPNTPSTAPIGAAMPAPAAAATNAPSLRGTDDQLKEARAFMSGATSANAKSRPGSRQRVLSREPSRTGAPSSRSSAASATSSRSYAPAVGPVRPRPSTTMAAPSPSQNTGTAGAGLSQWQALRGQDPSPHHSSVKQQAPTPSVAAQATATKTEIQAQKPLSAFTFRSTVEPAFKDSPQSPKKEATPISVADTAKTGGEAKPAAGRPSSWQLKEITNTLKDRASDVVPPHKRDKSAVADQAIEEGPLASTSKIEESGSINETTAPNVPRSTMTILTSDPTTVEPVADDRSDIGAKRTEVPSSGGNGTAANSSGSGKVHGVTDEVAKKSMVNGDGAVPTDTEAGNREATGSLKEQLAAVSDRVAALEEENHKLHQQVESLIQRDERRRFLGTDSANTPFGVNVQDANGSSIRVQGASSLLVGDLIRRIRVKANTSSSSSKNPRIALGEQQLGHAMTLGEAGIQQDSVLLFTYDGGH